MKVDVQVERTAEALDKRHGARLCLCACEPGFADQVRDAVSNGWRSYLFANQDPAMASLHASQEYQAPIQQVEML